MPSWRESDPEPTKPPKPSKPVKPDIQNRSSKPLKPLTGSQAGWRGKGKGTGLAAPKSTTATPQKDWLTPDTPDSGFSKSSFRKWTKIGVLFTVLVTSTGIVCWKLFYRPPKLPLYAVSVGKYENVPEFRENPFGNSQRGQVEKINRNYIEYFPKDLKSNDNLLESMRGPDWLEKLKPPALLTESRNPATAFYINCFARINSDSIELFHQSSRPFDSSDTSDKLTIGLQDLLMNLAKNIPKGKSRFGERYAWVILDLQVPHVLSNLSDLSPPWRDAVERTLERIEKESPDLHSRLIVTLPADNGQNNWLAPEYSASFFGHHFFRLLDTPQEKSAFIRRFLEIPLSLDEFRRNLDRAVRNDVANRRYALQQPVWLPENNLQVLKTGLVPGGRGKDLESKPVGDMLPRMQEIIALWRKLNQGEYRDAYRWDPVGYARAESQLLALEEFALYQPECFDEALEEAKKILDQIFRPTIQYHVSLIEDAMRARYFCGPDRAEQLTGSGWVNQQIAQGESSVIWNARSTSDKSPAGGSTVESLQNSENEDKNRKNRLVWETYLQSAKDEQSWDRAFQRRPLETALAYLDAGFRADPPPIEVYLLQRLRDDVDWRNDFDGVGRRAKACAEALKTFEKLQTLASQPEPLLAGWVQKPLLEPESDFLLGFDWLLANDFDKSIECFSRSLDQLNSLEQKVKNLAQLVEASQDILQISPHILAWSLREHQFSNETKAIQADLKELGHAVQESMDLFQYLAAQVSQISALSIQDSHLLNGFPNLGLGKANWKSKFTAYVDDKTSYKRPSAPESSSQTFRRNRIALLCPLLDLVQRERLHEEISKYLALKQTGSRNGDAEESPKDQSQLLEPLNLQDVIGQFLSGISADQKYRDLWNSLSTSDLRYALADTIQSIPSPESSGDQPGTETKMALALSAELSLRILAGVIGDSPSIYRWPDSQRKWPYSAPLVRWKTAEIDRCNWQVERLAEAGWGNGTIPGQADPSGFYFGRMANLYFGGLLRHETVSDPRISHWAAQREQASKSKLKERTEGLQKLNVQFGEKGQSISESESNSGTVRAPISVWYEPWKAIAAVHLGKAGQSVPWLSSRKNDRWWPVDLSAMVSVGGPPQRTETTKAFSTEYWDSSDPPVGTIAVRGNYRQEQIKWQSKTAPSITIELARRPVGDAEILVDSASRAPVMNIIILLDCSDSMNLEVAKAVEGASRGKESQLVKLFAEVSDNAKRVINELAWAHENGEADMRVCIIPFGVNLHKDLKSNFLKENLSERRLTAGVNGIDVGHFYATKSFIVLDEAGKNSLVRVIDELANEEKRDTPLYDAIGEACERIKLQQAEIEKSETPLATSQVLVFSDGVNDVLSQSPYKSTHFDLLRAVKATQMELKIFHYDHFDEWVRKQKWSDSEKGKMKEKDMNGRKELGHLVKNSDRIRYTASSNAIELVGKSMETIPKTEVELVPLSSSDQNKILLNKSGKTFRTQVSSDLLPGTFNVTSTGTRGGARQQLFLSGGERVQLMLSSSANPNFEFPPFEADTAKNRSWIATNQPQRSGGGFSSDLWYREDLLKPLSFVWTMRNQDKRQFTLRPQFVVGMISSSRPEEKRTAFVLADHYFESRTHYPILRFSQIPKADIPWSAKTVDLSLWIADRLPPELDRVSVVQDDVGVKEMGKAVVKWKRTESNLTVEVLYSITPSQLDERVVVICPSATKAVRKLYTDSNNELCEFTIDEQQVQKPVELQISTIGQLKKWVSKGELAELFIDDVKVPIGN